MTQQEVLSRTFVELTQALTTEFDVIDLLHVLADRTLELLSADAVGLMLTDQRGQLQVMAATSHASRLLELFELQNSEGPCFDSFHSGEQVVNVNIEEVMERWPSFSSECRQAGFESVHALPLRLGDQEIGAMNLFCAEHMTLTPSEVSVGQALADVATIGLLQQRSAQRADVLAEQLQTALNSRVTIEQAKGALAEHLGIDVDTAFVRLRTYAIAHSIRLNDVAESVLYGDIDPHELRERTDSGWG